MQSAQNLKLEEQAWSLRLKLNRLIEAESKGFAVRYSTPQMKKRLYRAHANAYERFKRRQDNLFNYQSGDLCRFPVQSPDAVGQGSTNL